MGILPVMIASAIYADKLIFRKFGTWHIIKDGGRVRIVLLLLFTLVTLFPARFNP